MKLTRSIGSWQDWLQTAMQLTQNALREKCDGMLFLGGEPPIQIPSDARPGRGERLTHLSPHFKVQDALLIRIRRE